MASGPEFTLGVAAGLEDGSLEGSSKGSELLLLGFASFGLNSLQVLEKDIS